MILASRMGICQVHYNFTPKDFKSINKQSRCSKTLGLHQGERPGTAAPSQTLESGGGCVKNRAGHEVGGPEAGTTDKLWDLRDGLGSQSPLLKMKKMDEIISYIYTSKVAKDI